MAKANRKKATRKIAPRKNAKNKKAAVSKTAVQKSTVNNPAIWFEIYVSDMKRAKKFYETVLKVKFTQIPFGDGEMWGFPSNPAQWGCSGALVAMPGMNARNNGTLIYFSTKNCTTEEKRVVAAGGKIFKPKMSIGKYGFISLLHDTEGNMIGLHSMQ